MNVKYDEMLSNFAFNCNLRHYNKVFYEGREVGTEQCKDTHANCHGWAEQNECSKNPGYMMDACPLSCMKCSGRWHEGSYEKPL